MTETPPLPWVKWSTRLNGDPDWRTFPIAIRGVFPHLVLLGATSPVRWLVRYSDSAIAGLIGVTPKLIAETVDLLGDAGYLRRTRQGIEILRTEMFAPPANYDPAAAYGRLTGERKDTESPPKAGDESAPNVAPKRSSRRSSSPSLALADLPTKAAEWWSSLVSQYPSVDLAAELQKAQDWHGADKVKSPKLFFRNWVDRAARDRSASDAVPAPTGSVLDQMRQLEEQMAVPA